MATSICNHGRTYKKQAQVPYQNISTTQPCYKMISIKKNTAYKKIETRPNSIHAHLLQNDQAFMLIT